MTSMAADVRLIEVVKEFPELRAFLSSYEASGSIGRFDLYLRIHR